MAKSLISITLLLFANRVSKAVRGEGLFRRCSMNNPTETNLSHGTRYSGYRRNPGEIVFDVINVVMFTLFMVLCIFPFYYLFINTISDNDLVLKGAITYYPVGINFSNYIALKEVSDLANAFIVTVSRTIIGTALMVFASALAGYLVTKKKLWKRGFWYRYLVITMYFNAGLIPWYMNMVMLGLTENYMAYIIPGIVAPFNIILVKTYIESIPAELRKRLYRRRIDFHDFRNRVAAVEAYPCHHSGFRSSWELELIPGLSY